MNKNRPKQAVTAVLQSFNRLLWPARCLNCDLHTCEENDELCRDCWQQLQEICHSEYCPRCGRDVSSYAVLDGKCANCQQEHIHFDRIARAGSYNGALRKMLLALKFSDRTELLDVLAPLASSALQAAPFCDNIDYLVPVPMHWRRRVLRGYNQALLLAKKLVHPAGICTDLVRIRHTKPQTAFDNPETLARQRAENVALAFAVRPAHNLASKTVCLVDDIKTTGATLNECAKTLKNAGAARVYALVLAVAGQDNQT